MIDIENERIVTRPQAASSRTLVAKGHPTTCRFSAGAWKDGWGCVLNR